MFWFFPCSPFVGCCSQFHQNRIPFLSPCLSDISMERAIILLFPALSFALSLSSFEKPRAILHIGPHQTGSTDLQNNLILNRNVFSQYQYLVLMKNIKSGNAFVNSFAALNGEKRKGERLKKPDLESVLQRIKKKKKSFILSSEEFDTLKQKTINKLGTILKGYNVTILAYHRQKTEHLRSLWALQNKENPSPKEFIPWAEKHILSSSSERTSFGLLPTLDRFSSVFGNESIRLVSFEGSIARSNPFFVLVGDILGLPLHFFKKYFGTTNQSPPTFLMNFVAIASNVSSMDHTLLLLFIIVIFYISLFFFFNLSIFFLFFLCSYSFYSSLQKQIVCLPQILIKRESLQISQSKSKVCLKFAQPSLGGKLYL